MLRPTAAHLVYGSVTVVGATVALLLILSPVSGPGVALVGVAALLLGLLVTLGLAVLRARTEADTGRPGGRGASAPEPEPAASLRR